MLRIAAALKGDLTLVMHRELKTAARAVTTGVHEAGVSLRDELRSRTRAAGFASGEKLGRAWRANTYPRGGRDSLGAAALVYSKSERIHALMAEGGTLRAAGGSWRVIPLAEAIRRGWAYSQGRRQGGGGAGLRSRHSDVEAAMRAMGALRFVKIGPGKALLVAENLTSGLRRAKGRKRKDGSIGAAKGRASAPLFLLVKVTRHGKRFDIPSAVAAASQRMASRIVEHWARQEAA